MTTHDKPISDVSAKIIITYIMNIVIMHYA